MVTAGNQTGNSQLVTGDLRLRSIVRDNVDAKRPFVVTFNIDGEPFVLNVSATELQSFRQFQRAALDRANAMCRQHDERPPRMRGYRNDWSHDVDYAIAAGGMDK